MKSLQTTGIVLGRTDYGEADRIIIFLTPDYGKLRLMARGVRKVKSKLAGGIELFSTSHLSFLKGKGEIGTLVSTRLITHYGNIVTEHERLQLGYQLIKTLNKATEDEPEPEYYHLMEQAFVSLNNPKVALEIIEAWFIAQLLRLAGHTPNLYTDVKGAKLEPNQKYNFDFESVAFLLSPRGNFSARHIKTLRLLFSNNTPEKLATVQGTNQQLTKVGPLLKSLQTAHLHI